MKVMGHCHNYIQRETLDLGLGKFPVPLSGSGSEERLEAVKTGAGEGEKGVLPWLGGSPRLRVELGWTSLRPPDDPSYTPLLGTENSVQDLMCGAWQLSTVSGIC